MIKNHMRFNETRPYVEGVAFKRDDPDFIAWFEQNKGDYSEWFVKKVKARNTHCIAVAVNECEKATKNYNY